MNCHAVRILRWTCALSGLVVIAACGSGGSTSAPPAPAMTQAVRTYYDPDTKLYPRESGEVLLDSAGRPTDLRDGLWTSWHPPEEGNARHFEKTYQNGNWDPDSYWREWNADTTLRFDWQDR